MGLRVGLVEGRPVGDLVTAPTACMMRFSFRSSALCCTSASSLDAANAERLANEYGARSASLDKLAEEVAAADIVITCAGASGLLVPADMVGDRSDHPIALIDLALPHDIDPDAGSLPGATLIDLAALADELHASPAGKEVLAVRDIVTQEVAAFLSARRQSAVTPTVVALRTMAADVVASEIARLEGRLPDLDDKQRGEITQTVRRVVDKLLHAPTVRVKQLAAEPGGAGYADALRTLFDLDPETVARVSRADGADRPPVGAVTGLAAPGPTSTMKNTENARNRGRA